VTHLARQREIRIGANKFKIREIRGRKCFRLALLQSFKNLAYFALSSATSGVRERPVRFKKNPCNRAFSPIHMGVQWAKTVSADLPRRE
jgi:hypothetical protein